MTTPTPSGPFALATTPSAPWRSTASACADRETPPRRADRRSCRERRQPPGRARVRGNSCTRTERTSRPAERRRSHDPCARDRTGSGSHARTPRAPVRPRCRRRSCARLATRRPRPSSGRESACSDGQNRAAAAPEAARAGSDRTLGWRPSRCRPLRSRAPEAPAEVSLRSACRARSVR